MSEHFIVRNYSEDEGPVFKGNGFDGTRVGDDREDAEALAAWINQRIDRIRELEAELEHYRVEGAYQRGYKDAIQNDGRTNPYPVGTESSRLWSAGFSTVDRKEEPR